MALVIYAVIGRFVISDLPSLSTPLCLNVVFGILALVVDAVRLDGTGNGDIVELSDLPFGIAACGRV